VCGSLSADMPGVSAHVRAAEVEGSTHAWKRIGATNSFSILLCAAASYKDKKRKRTCTVSY